MRFKSRNCRGKRRGWSKSGLGEQGGIFTLRPGYMRIWETKGRATYHSGGLQLRPCPQGRSGFFLAQKGEGSVREQTEGQRDFTDARP